MSDLSNPTTLAVEKQTRETRFLAPYRYHALVDEICQFRWPDIDQQELTNVAWVYYYFSVQFRECLEAACAAFPDDALLRELDCAERNTDNLSPWPGVARPGELLNHDEFMRRTLQLSHIDEGRRLRLDAIGVAYLTKTRSIDRNARIKSLATYEDGGLEMVFRSILRAHDWRGPLLQAFRHFLVEHIKFDSDPEHGHGAICRHLAPDDSVMPLWSAFRDMLVAAVPKLAEPE